MPCLALLYTCWLLITQGTSNELAYDTESEQIKK